MKDLGFDIDVARDNLVRWLIQDGRLVARIIDPVGCSVREEIFDQTKLDEMPARLREQHKRTLARADSTGDDLQDEWRRTISLHDMECLIKWQCAYAVASIHLNQGGHGVPVFGVDRCSYSPCKVEAVSFALSELTHYYHGCYGSGITHRELAEKLERLARYSWEFDQLAPEIHALCKELAERAPIYLQGWNPDFLKRPFIWEECVDAIKAGVVSPEKCLNLAAKLRQETFQTAGLRRVPALKGRPRQGLLTVICQHLYDGGFTYREIEQLVQAERGASQQSAKRRIQQRVRQSDERTLVPYEVSSRQRSTPVGRGASSRGSRA